MKSRMDGFVLCLLCCVGILGIGLFSLPTVAVYYGATFFWGYILLASFACAVTVALAVLLPEEAQGGGKCRYSVLFSWGYTIFYMAISAFLLAYYAHTVQSWFLDGVPHFLIVVFLVAVCLQMAAKSDKTMARAVALVGIFVLPTVLIMRFLMLFSGDMRNLLPIFETENTIQLPMGVLFLCGFFVPLGLIGIWDTDRKTKVRSGVVAVFVCAVVFILAGAGCVSILGTAQTAVRLDSTVLAMKNLNLSKLDLLQRGDIVFILTWSVLMPAAGTVICHIPYKAACRLCPKAGHGKLFLMFFILYVLIGVFVPNEEMALQCLIYTAVGGGTILLLYLFYRWIIRRIP